MLAGVRCHSTPSSASWPPASTRRSSTPSIGQPIDSGGSVRSGRGAHTTGPASVVPYEFITSAPGKVAFTASQSLSEIGAEPMRTVCTDERSTCSSRSRCCRHIANIGGTPVSQVQR